MTLFRRSHSVLCMLLAPAAQSQIQSPPYTNLAVIKPVISCTDLAKADLSKAADRPGTIQSAEVIDTAKGQFCKVLGTVASSVAFEELCSEGRQAGGEHQVNICIHHLINRHAHVQHDVAVNWYL